MSDPEYVVSIVLGPRYRLGTPSGAVTGACREDIKVRK